ncbi:MAG TPA: hypothetical protein VMJ10_30545 [Kofleriaceae bacterium]|nr:hypothetical protein [Kofleriaceae bacterium]
MRGSLLALATLATGCTFGEADHQPLPQVVDSGGPVQASPQWAVITFPGDPLASDINAFLTSLGTSNYWNTVAGQYGVGAATAIAVPASGGAPTMIDDAGIQQYLYARLRPLASGWPAPDTNTVYALYFPDTTTVANTCTAGLAAYHSSFMLGSTPVSYAVIPRCGVQYNQDPLDELTALSSHELAESATDPQLQSSPAYATASDYGWQSWSGGGEIADLCQYMPGSVLVEPELGHLVERVWSNEVAAAGHDPCVPQPDGDTFFDAAPETTDTVTLSFTNGMPDVTTPGLYIPVHSTRKVDVQLFSDAPTDPIVVSAAEQPIDAAAEQPPDLSLSWDRTTGSNGDTLHLTITVDADSHGEGHEYLVITSQVGDLQRPWPVVIAN